MIQTNCNRNIRKKFGKFQSILDVPSLIAFHQKSYNEFLQKDISSEQRKEIGLQKVFKRIFPIHNKNQKLSLEFRGYELGTPKYSVNECKQRSITYSSPLIVTMILALWDISKATKNRNIKELREEEVYFGEMPLMTDKGTFIINGNEKVVINQLKLSPGVYFGYRNDTKGVTTYSAKIVPNRGYWINLELKSKVSFNVKIGNKEISAIDFLSALSFSDKEIKALLTTINTSSANILKLNKIPTQEEASKKIYKKLYQRESRKDVIDDYFENLFFHPNNNFDLSNLGRIKFNQRLNLNIPKDVQTLRKEDIISTIKYLIDLKNGKGEVDDIAHFSNKRVKTVGELIEEQYFKALKQEVKTIQDRMLGKDMEKVMPSNVLYMKRFDTVVQKFFTSKEETFQTQILEQYNPLSEVAHKRRLTVLGPGAPVREKISTKLREVHSAHYGRICPLETPESENVGFLTSLSTYARINDYGFIETPYRKVKNGVVINKIEYLSPPEEEKHTIAQATESVNHHGKFTNKMIAARKKGETVTVKPNEVDYIDVSPSQILSISASLIPFIEHNDSNRALMASNMQRQAVPLLKPEAPLIGTGMEKIVARDSDTLIIARRDGIVIKVNANRIMVQPGSRKEPDNIKTLIDIYKLIKYQRSNQKTCINQRPVVKVGDIVKKGDIIADSHSTEMCELALGKNLLVAFISWRGYNFEDAILINENICKKDYFTSLHLEEFEIEERIIRKDKKARKDSKEEITREIPGISKDLLKNLDEHGVIREGTYVKAGDILVGRVTPKEEIQPDILDESDKIHISEERIPDVKNTSLRVPPGIRGTVIDTKTIKDNLPSGLKKQVKVTIATKRRLSVGDKMAGRHGNKGVISKIVPEEDMPYLDDGTPVDIALNPLGMITRMNPGQILETHLGWAAKQLGEKIKEFIDNNYKIEKLKKFLKNIFPEDEVAEFLNTASDEEILSLAKRLVKGVPMESPSFDSASEKEIEECLKLAGLPEDGKTILYNGRTGERFSQKATVGIIYMMKLHHMVENIIHARAIGHYTQITQQPQEGRARFGGQRIGDMEAWALYGYGAAYTLQEAFTSKSDDLKGRNELYASIYKKGDPISEPHVPESSKVLVKQLQGLCLDVKYSGQGRKASDKHTWLDFVGDHLSIPLHSLSAIKIGIASPDVIRAWSKGEIKEPKAWDDSNDKYTTNGTFCAKIFGPTENYKCDCGLYKGSEEHPEKVCENCGVEILPSHVRRERMGHIELLSPVAHIWFLKSIATLLDIKIGELKRILSFESYIVTDPKKTNMSKMQLLTLKQYNKAREKHGKEFKAEKGAEVIRDLLIKTKKSELKQRYKALVKEVKEIDIGEKRREKLNNLKIIRNFIRSNIKPEWLILERITVIPPGLRPHIQVEGDDILHDISELYRKLLNTNKRLKALKEHKALEADIIKEKKKLQEAVDSLIHNGRNGKLVFGNNNQPLKSFTNQIEKKEGYFRRDVVGKRVDYSGRSVIVAGPELKLHQCGLPREMAFELFRPFLYDRLISSDITSTLREAKKLVDIRDEKAWDPLDELIKGYPILLNRNPTLHRMNIQAFEPVLVAEKAIQFHPLVCASYAADFDGDTMAVHVPISKKVKEEARDRLMSTQNILSPAHGKPIIAPSQDIVLGIYYLTRKIESPKRENILSLEETRRIYKVYSNSEEVRIAYNNAVIDLHDNILVRIEEEIIETTAGRIILSEIVPSAIPFDLYNKELKKGDLMDLISLCFQRCGQDEAVLFCDRLKDLGFEQATLSGISIGIKDMIVSNKKEDIVRKGSKKIEEIEDQFKKGLTTEGEKREKIVNIWKGVVDKVEKETAKILMNDNFNPLFMMVDSGARGNINLLRQITAMRGLTTNSSGELTEQSINKSFVEGYTSIEYFTSTYGSRKALIYDKTKSASKAGHLTRRLVYAAQNSIITEKNCNTKEGITIRLQPNISTERRDWIKNIIVGRISLEDIKDREFICRKNEGIDEGIAEKIITAGVKEIMIRSPITCKSKNGICAFCYGRDLSRRRIVNIGDAVGIIAAQSIGEPITQFSIGAHKKGVAVDLKKGLTSTLSRIEGLFNEAKVKDAAVLSKSRGKVEFEKESAENNQEIIKCVIVNDKKMKIRHLVKNKKVIVSKGQIVDIGNPLTEGDICPQEILKVKGMDGVMDAAQLLVDYIEEIYIKQDMSINRKHFEVIVREMLKYIKIIDGGDTNYLPAEIIERRIIEKENKSLAKDKTEATFEPVILGVKEIPSHSEGVLSAASFEKTPTILANAALEERVDHLKGIQENVILGRLIPVGTGHPKYTA